MNALNYETLVARYVERFKSLLAWGGAMPKCEYKFERHKGQACKGWAIPAYGTMVIRLGGELADDLRIVLHEMAHLAAPTREHHGIAWKTLYARAAAEAFGADVDDFDLNVTKNMLDMQVAEAAAMFLAQGGY